MSSEALILCVLICLPLHTAPSIHADLWTAYAVTSYRFRCSPLQPDPASNWKPTCSSRTPQLSLEPGPKPPYSLPARS
ncbi:hypothetical protein BD310DRAFT_938109 [Dichomitus squalens]|uniref:Secreted protein n=1 Tax=Dichomitus squalens TaxID=114155 RepID=A0A4V2K6T1_9APHY|nr:hypothetical protein BD310DRAFT_938109 [Dichomitus squalens]